MTSSPLERTQVFLCYSHKDKRHAERFLAHLRIYRDRGLVEGWSDQDLQAGELWRTKIFEALARTKVAVLLLSVDFFNSDFIQHEELPRILEAARLGELTILQVLVGNCAYEMTELEPYQFALSPAKAIEDMSRSERNRAWKRVCAEIEKALRGPVRAAPGHAWNQPTLFEPPQQEASADTQAARREEEAAQQEEAFAQEYRQALCTDPQLTMIQVLDMDHPLTLDDIYVRVRIHRERRYRASLESAESSMQTGQEHDPLAILRSQQKYLEERERAGLEPEQAVQQHLQSVVVGDPGAGKTTLLKYLTLQVARGNFREIADDAVFVSLHTFARKRQGDEGLLEYILRDWQRVYHFEEAHARRFLQSRLRAGRMLVLLDALDETMLGDDSEQAEQTYQTIHEAVSDLRRAYPQTPMMVTARKAAYHQHAPLVGFDLLEVVDFLPEQVEAFVRNWFRHDPQEERRDMAEGLLASLQNNPRLSALAANPLLLGLIAYTYEENNERLPSNRADLYKICVETLLRKWDDKRRIRRAHPAINTYEQERLLPRVAWHFHAQGLRYFSRRELLVCIKDFAESLGKSTREEHLQDILDEITSDNGLLREQAHETYGFLHLTLQEYFAARHLANTHSLDVLLEQLGHPWWEEVILLYAGLADDASELLMRLLSPGGDGEAPEDIFCSKLLLAGRCLAAQVQLTLQRDLRAAIPLRLREQLSSPFSLLQQQAAEVLAEIGRTYPEHEANNWLLEMVANTNVPLKLRLLVLDGIGSAGGRELQRRLLSLLRQPSLSRSIATKIVDLLQKSRDRALVPQLKELLEDPDSLAMPVGDYLIDIFCACADTATLEWLLDRLESSKDLFLYQRAFNSLSTCEREDKAIIVPYVRRAFSRFPPDNLILSHGMRLLAQCLSPELSDFLEEVLWNRGYWSFTRRSALAALRKLGWQKTELLVARILEEPGESEHMRETIVAVVTESAQPDLIQRLLALLDNQATPLSLRLEIAEGLWQTHPQAVRDALWAMVAQVRQQEPEDYSLTALLQAFTLLIEGGDATAMRDLHECLVSTTADRWHIGSAANGKYMRLKAYRDVELYLTPDAFIERIVEHGKTDELLAICRDRRIYYAVRASFIEQIARSGRHGSLAVPIFLADLADRTLIEEVRLALAEALGELAGDEQTLETLLALSQDEPSNEVKNALYTALARICRRANVTIVPEGPLGSVLRVMKR